MNTLFILAQAANQAAPVEKNIHPGFLLFGLLVLIAVCGFVFHLMGWSKPKK